MTIDIHQQNKQLIGKFRAALYDCDISVTGWFNNYPEN